MRTRLLLWSLVLVAAAGLAGLILQYPVLGAAPAANSCPDLVPSITLDPPAPKPGQQFGIRITVANQGTADAGGFFTYSYVDPVDQPPTAITPDNHNNRIDELPAGESYSFLYPYTFTAIGRHVVYAWSDRANKIADECSETNNVVSLVVEVSNCAADSFEVHNDNTCTTARSLTTDGARSRHNLCPVNDQDWVRFDGQAGITYQIVADNLEQDADVVFRLYDDCADPAIAEGELGFGVGISMEAPVFTDGPYFLQVKHHDATHGDATGYDLSVSALCSADGHEPDDRCALARELAAGAAAQTRGFCRSGDEDWVALWVTGGKEYRLATSAWESKSQPQIELYDSCGGQPFLSVSGRAPITWQALETGPILARVRNANRQDKGLDTGYQLQFIETTPDAPEPPQEEPNNTPQEARLLPPGQPQQWHFTAPGDQDWLRFDAIAGQSYRIETYGLSSATDTVLCLHDVTSQLIQCDDDTGQGLGSLLFWRAPATGVYYLRVYDAISDRGGVESTYQIELQPAATMCNADRYEPDGELVRATEIAANAQPVQHNFCPGGDVDWARVAISAPGVYEFFIDAQGPDADPLLTLFDRDEKTALFTNDDFGPGLSARILWRFTQAGVYPLRIESFDGRSAGRGAEYSIRIAPTGEEPTRIPQPTPTATPTATPTPQPTPTLGWPVPVPTPNGPAQVLLVANRARMETIYGSEGANLVMNRLAQLVTYPYAPGLLLNLDGDANTMRAYADWQVQPGSVGAANRVVDAVRGQIGVYLQQHSTIQYVVLIGGDNIIPFRRVRDGHYGREERDYLPQMNTGPLGQALLQNMTLVDDYYVAGNTLKVAGQPLYLPERVISRLVETPAQISAYIDRFLSHKDVDYVLDLASVQVAGAHNPRDSLKALCRRLPPQINVPMQCEYVDNTWDRSQFLSSFVVNSTPGVKVIGTAGGHSRILTSNNSEIEATELAPASQSLERGVVVAMVAHGGLNVPENEGFSLDLPEVYLSHTALYASGTGWMVYADHGDASGMGRLLNLFVEQMFRPTPPIADLTVGRAWLRAKWIYWQQVRTARELDRKVLHTSVLYGLPMYRIRSAFNSSYDPFPGVSVVAGTMAGAAEGANLLTPPPYTDTLALGIKYADTLQLTTTGDGSYYALDGHTDASADLPVQPLYYAPLRALGIYSPTGAPRGVLWTGGIYTDVVDFDPVIPGPLPEDPGSQEIARAASELSAAAITAQGGGLSSLAWDTPVLGNLDTDGQSLAIVWGQFSSAQATERVFDTLNFEFTFSDLPDTLPPAIALARAQAQPILPRVKLHASDPSGIKRVLIVYTNNLGAVQSIDLTYQPDMQKWTGEIPTLLPVTWFAQVVDNAGNVARITDKGNLFVAGEGQHPPAPQFIFLPSITR